MRKKSKILIAALALLLAVTVVTATVGFYLYCKNPEIRIMKLEEIRSCPIEGRILVVLAMIKNKILLSFNWDSVKHELLAKNPGLTEQDIFAEIDYTGYWVNIDSKGKNLDLSPMQRMKSFGCIGIDNAPRPMPQNIKDFKNNKNIVIAYFYAIDDMDSINYESLEQKQEFWHIFDVQMRMN